MSLALAFLSVLAPAPIDDAALAETGRRIVEHQRTRSQAYEHLTELCDDIGHRLSGSPGADRAVQWGVEKFRQLGLDARLHRITVPKWVRGRPEDVRITSPREVRLASLALGGSIGTGPAGLEAAVMVVDTFDELRERAEEAEGKIVLFNRAMGPDGEGGTLGYGDVVTQRVGGAIEAARVGAVGSLIRSVGSADFRLPHTGMMRYQSDVPKIPHVAISSEDADLIARFVARGKAVHVSMRLDCRDAGEVPSANVIGELRGRERPDEVVVIAGHLDSWDVGQGALDDGTGVAACIEALRCLKELDLVPRRSIRAVLYMNEENGLAGGRAYAEDFAGDMDRHVAAIEMDGGSFDVQGFGVSAGAGGVEVVRRILRPLSVIGAHRATVGGGGADIGPMRALGVPQIGLRSDSSRYFDYHHTEADTLDKVDPDALAECAAALAHLAWALAESEEPLARLP